MNEEQKEKKGQPSILMLMIMMFTVLVNDKKETNEKAENPVSNLNLMSDAVGYVASPW